LTRTEEVNGTETYVTTYAYTGAGDLSYIRNHLNQLATAQYDLLGRKLSLVDPNIGTWTYSYDAAGNLLSQTDAKNQTLTFTYDALRRVTSKRYPDGTQILWTYDDPAVAYSKGHATRVASPITVTNYAYDAVGRVTQWNRLLDGTTYGMSRTYDALGNVVSQTFPDSETVTYNYNEAGWLASVPRYITSVTYNAQGQRTQVQYTNGVTSTRSYSPVTLRLTNLATSGP